MQIRPTHQSILMFAGLQVCPVDRRMKNRPVRSKANADSAAGIIAKARTKFAVLA